MAVIVKINFIYFKKPYVYLHYVPNMFTKYEKNPTKTVEVADYNIITYCAKSCQKFKRP